MDATFDGEEFWGRRCVCGHTIGDHSFVGVCVMKPCPCKQERPRPGQVQLAGPPEDE